MTSSRVLLFTGKGGVGKTTTAAATALRCADDGLRTVVLSTDPAHSLADAFGVELGPLPVEIAPNLFGQQLDAQDRLEEAWADVQGYLLEVMAWAGLEGVEAEELSVLPGLDEVFALADIRQHAESEQWDVVVVDCAPTAETLRLLSLPEVLSWYMERIFPTTRTLTKVVSPVLSRVMQLPTPGDAVFGALERFYARLAGVRELLTDPRRTSVRLVVNPERMVIAEAKRTYTYLSLFGYRVDGVIANRLLPDSVTDPWFDAWKVSQAEHVAVIEEGFEPVPILKVELAAGEIDGLDDLRVFAKGLYGDEDPSGLLHEGEPMSVIRRGASMVLRLPLPGAGKDELDLAQHGDELLVRVGPYRRAVVLPDSLRRRPVSAASMIDGGARGAVRRTGAAQRMSEARGAQEQAVEYLQTAAIEAIKAMRTFLDIAESLVKEPEAAATIAKAFAEAAAAAMRPSTLAGEDDGEAEQDVRDNGGLRRIDLD